MKLTNDNNGSTTSPAVLKPSNDQPTTTGIRLGKGSHNKQQRIIRKRTEPPKQCLTLDVSVPPSFRAKISRAWMVRTSVRALLIHVLYIRGVVPTPTLEILRQHAELSSSSSKTTRTSTSMIPRDHRSLFKCGSMSRQLLHQWEELIMSTSSSASSHDYCANNIGAILISLGQSWSRQRERYVLQVNGLGLDAGNSTSNTTSGAYPTVQQEHTVSRRIISAFMNATNSNGDDLADFMAQPALGASSYQVQLSVWMTTSDAERLFATTSNSKCLVRHHFKVDATPAPPRRRNNKPVLIQTRIMTGAESSVDWDEGEGIWMTLPTAVKGFRLSR